VAEYLRRAAVVGITWPVPPELDDAALERKLFTPPFASMEAVRPQPDWPSFPINSTSPVCTAARIASPSPRRDVAGQIWTVR
jgi:hypothetical protein